MCGQPVWKVGRCIRRHTSCQQRQKVCKKRRLNLRFKDPLARPVPFRPLGCVPHGWECFARGIKCRIVSAPAPLPLTVRNYRCILLSTGPSGTPAPTTYEEVCPSIRRGRRPRRPAIGENAPIFCMVSGSGAGRQTIQNLGNGLPKVTLIDGKGSPETIGFWRIFGNFLCVQKVTRRRLDKPIHMKNCAIAPQLTSIISIYLYPFSAM